jgi:hypothetical protein
MDFATDPLSAIAWTHVRSEELESLVDFVLGAVAFEFHKALSMREHSIHIVFTTKSRLHTCWIPSGTCTGGQSACVRILPATFVNPLLNNERVSGVSYDERNIDCRRWDALNEVTIPIHLPLHDRNTHCPSKYQGLMREKSESWDSFGKRLRCEKTSYQGYVRLIQQWGEVDPSHLQVAPVLHGQHIQLIHHEDFDRRKEVPVSSTNESKYPTAGRITEGLITFPSQ